MNIGQSKKKNTNNNTKKKKKQQRISCKILVQRNENVILTRRRKKKPAVTQSERDKHRYRDIQTHFVSDLNIILKINVSIEYRAQELKKKYKNNIYTQQKSGQR